MSKKDREGNRAARAAAIQKQQASQERNRKVLIVVAVLVVLAAVVAAGVLFTGGDKEPAAGGGAQPKAVARGQALVVGDNPDAKVKVVVFEDFLCPYCREFEAATRSYLRKDAEAGKVLVEYRPFHLLQDPYSSLALTSWGAVLQKGTGKQALAFHDVLFDKQPYEADADKPDATKLRDWARTAGVKDDDVLSSFGKADAAFVDATNLTASEADVQGTPTVVVNDKVLQGSPADQSDQLKALIAKG